VVSSAKVPLRALHAANMANWTLIEHSARMAKDWRVLGD